jgi:hypothetical protein
VAATCVAGVDPSVRAPKILPGGQAFWLDDGRSPRGRPIGGHRRSALAKSDEHSTLAAAPSTDASTVGRRRRPLLTPPQRLSQRRPARTTSRNTILEAARREHIIRALVRHAITYPLRREIPSIHHIRQR